MTRNIFLKILIIFAFISAEADGFVDPHVHPPPPPSDYPPPPPSPGEEASAAAAAAGAWLGAAAAAAAAAAAVGDPTAPGDIPPPHYE